MAIAKGSCIVQVIVAPNRDVLRRPEIAEHNHRFGLDVTINGRKTPKTQIATSLYCVPYCDSSSDLATARAEARIRDVVEAGQLELFAELT
jgi:hypothetical protein